jgi:HPt (histidine-containing phosphotransfer) domain-containing protein
VRLPWFSPGSCSDAGIANAAGLDRNRREHMDMELTELKKEFLQEAEAKVVDIRARMEGVDGSPPSEDIEKMIDLAHQLKGAGGSYGYSDISRYAADLEDHLESLKGGGSPALAESIDRELGTLAEKIRNYSDELG